LLGDKFEVSGLPENFADLDTEKAFSVLVEQVQLITSKLPTIPFKQIDIEDIKEELKTLEVYLGNGEKPKRKGEANEFSPLADMLDIALRGLPGALLEIPSGLDSLRRLIPALRTRDSINLNQVSNLLDKYLADFNLLLITEDADTKEEATQSHAQNISHLNHLRRVTNSLHPDSSESDFVFKRTLRQLNSLTLFAALISEGNLTPVEFNETGEIELVNGFSIFSKQEGQVKNTISLGPKTERVQLLTGPNGSGKTHHEKGAVAAILMALATGYAPAEKATMPIFDSVVYLDRVTKKEDIDLSSFAQDVEYWNVLLPLLKSKKAVFVAVDEAFSTTSPYYQAALTYSVVAEVLKSPHFMMLATHNHDVVKRLEEAGTPLVNPYHFKFGIQDGNIVYQYQRQPGHEASFGIEVARTMGLPAEITEMASRI
jgi:hypothetical protein